MAKQTEKQYIDRLVTVYIELATLEEDAKEIKDAAKTEGYNPALLSAVAKSIAKGKLDDLKDKSQSIIDLIASTNS